MTDYNESEWTPWIRHDPSKGRPEELRLCSQEEVRVAFSSLIGSGEGPRRVRDLHWDEFPFNPLRQIAYYKRRLSATQAKPALDHMGRWMDAHGKSLANTAQPAEQETADIDDGSAPAFYYGMSLRQYAAIKLRVPNSGTPWLDAMILEAKRDELAARVMQANLTNPELLVIVTAGDIKEGSHLDRCAKNAYQAADAMLAAKKGGAK